MLLYENLSNSPLLAHKFSHFKPHLVSVNSILDISHVCPSTNSRHHDHTSMVNTSSTSKPPVDEQELLNLIKVNKSVLSKQQCDQIRQINRNNLNVFDSNLKGGYNHFSGRFYADFTFSNKPPPTKVYVPQ